MNPKNKPLSILLLFILFSVFYAKSQNADINLLRKINLERNEKWDPTVKVITCSMYPVGVGSSVLVITIGSLKEDSAIVHKGLIMAESFLLNAAITTALKYGIKRERPFVTYPDLENVTTPTTPSFPSGHTSTAFSTATSLSLCFPKWYVIAPSFAWASAVGYSRLHLGVHYPSDVLVGALVGSGSAYLCYKSNQWIVGKIRKKSSKKL